MLSTLINKWGENILQRHQYAIAVALLFAFFAFFAPLLGKITSVIIALSTLQKGPRQGLLIISWAMLPAVAMLYLGHYPVFLDIVFGQYLLTWIFALILRQCNSWMMLLNISVLLGMGIILVIYYFFPGLEQAMIIQLKAIATQYKSNAVFTMQPNMVDKALHYITPFASALLAIAIIASNMTSVFLGRWWQSILVSSVSLQQECYSLRVPYGIAVLMVLLLTGLYLHDTVIVNILVIALIPFILSGFSLLHAVIATKKNASVVLFVFYTLFIFFSPYMLVCLSLLAWLDSFFDMRKKILKSTASS